MRIGVAKNKKKIFVYFHKKNIELHPLWLRERVSSKDLLDVNTGQRLYDPSILNHKLKIQNASIKNRLHANREDKKAWKINGLKPKAYTFLLKPLRKLNQFRI